MAEVKGFKSNHFPDQFQIAMTDLRHYILYWRKVLHASYIDYIAKRTYVCGMTNGLHPLPGCITYNNDVRRITVGLHIYYITYLTTSARLAVEMQRA